MAHRAHSARSSLLQPRAVRKPWTVLLYHLEAQRDTAALRGADQPRFPTELGFCAALPRTPSCCSEPCPGGDAAGVSVGGCARSAWLGARGSLWTASCLDDRPRPPELKHLRSCSSRGVAGPRPRSVSPLLAEGPRAMRQLGPSSVAPGQTVSLCLLAFTPAEVSGLKPPPPPPPSLLGSTSLHPPPLTQSLQGTDSSGYNLG